MGRRKSKLEKKINQWKNADPEDIFLELLPYAVVIVIGIIGASILVSLLSNYMAKETAQNLVDLITLDIGFFFNRYLELGGLIFAIVVTGLIIGHKKGYF